MVEKASEDTAAKHEPRRIEVCSTGAVPEGGTLKVETEGLTLAVFNVGGTFYVSEDHCTHGPGSLSDGDLDGYEIECDFHQGRFDVRTGAVTGPPAMIPVRTYAVTLEGDQVVIET
jgi:nitrite reductase/ring-hydroxylating ferredoxin subunit